MCHYHRWDILEEDHIRVGEERRGRDGERTAVEFKSRLICHLFGVTVKVRNGIEYEALGSLLLA